MIFFRYFKNSEKLDRLKEYIQTVKIGDWFVLYQMSKNLNRRFFYDFLIALAKEHQCNKGRPRHLENMMIESGLLDEPDLAATSPPLPPVSKSHEVEKSKEKLAPEEELNKSKSLDEPPPLMEDSPRSLKKIHTAW